MIQYYAMPGLKYRNQSVERADRTADAITEICHYLKMPFAQVKERNRSREIVDARCMVIYFLRVNLKLQLKSIAEIFKIDHTTVMYNVKRCRILMESDNSFLKQMVDIDRMVY